MPRHWPRRVGCCVPLGLEQSIEIQLTQRRVPVIQKVHRTVDVPLVQHIDWTIDVPAPQILEQIVEVLKIIPERVKHTLEQIVDVLVPLTVDAHAHGRKMKYWMERDDWNLRFEGKVLDGVLTVEKIKFSYSLKCVTFDRLEFWTCAFQLT